MPTLMEKLRTDRDAARRGRSDALASTLLVTLFAEAARVGKDDGNRETTDAEALSVVRKFIKNAAETRRVLSKAARDDTAVAREIDLLERYLPSGMPDDEVEGIARSAILVALADAEAAGRPLPQGGALKGEVVKRLKTALGDRFEGGRMVPIVDRVIAVSLA